MLINNLKDGEKVNATYLLKKYEIKTAKNGKQYLDAVLGDKSGEISAKMWDITSIKDSDISTGDVAKISGRVEKYNSALQFVITGLEKTQPSEEDIAQLIDTAPYPPVKMYEKIIDLLNQIDNADIKRIALTIFEENKEKLMYYPAAKNFHHAVKGGLLYHIYSMFRCALPLIDIYTFLNKDLVYAGIAIHDIGKISEMESDLNGIVSDYTIEGKLLGHIITTICMIDATAQKLSIDPETALLLKHMILSHHYHPEFGSPKSPMFAEAEMLHYLDVLDSRMNQMQRTLQSTEEGSFAEKVWILDGRTIYHHKLDTKGAADEGTV